MKFKTSEEVIALIEVKKRNSIDLYNLARCMEVVGNPQLKLKCIHVGGTNGKGSTTNAIASVLQTAKYKTGTFTSPYLETHHDRIRINDVNIRDQQIVEYANEYFDLWQQYDLSMFEIDMFIATMYFVDQEVDYAIFEVGLGGDQDATNIIMPQVCVITNIGMDHSDFLGDTYELIAQAKAGIIKPGVDLITCEKKTNCLKVFEAVCKQKGSQCICCVDYDYVLMNPYLSFGYRGHHFKQETLAAYQVNNSLLAIETIWYLRQHKQLIVSDEQIYEGIRHAVWRGRFEVVSEDPYIIVDGAHNLEGIEALVESSKQLKNIRILFSALQDKPYLEMIQLLKKLSDDITVCEFDFIRAAKVEVMAKDNDVQIIKDYRKAIDALKSKDHTLLICGSLYFISDVRKYILRKE